MAITREIPRPQHKLDISDDYRRMVKGALPDMGYNPEADDVPSLEQIQAGIGSIAGLAEWLVERADNGIQDTLVISRTVGGEQGIGVARTILGLDKNAFADGYVWSELWGNAQGNNNPYGDRGTIHDNAGEQGLQTMWDTAILLGDVADPASGNKAYDPGLAYTGKTVTAQREAFAKEAAELEKRGISIVTATLGAMATDYAAIRNEGSEQRTGITRFIHYPEQSAGADRVACVPGVYGDGRLDFYGTRADDGWDDGGARRLVRVPTPLDV